MSNSAFLASDQPEANPQVQTHSNPSSTLFYTAGDAAKHIGVSVTTIKRIAAELRLDLTQTVGGTKLFTAQQVEKVKAEKARRNQEAWK
jgi:hypothetical protein